MKKAFLFRESENFRISLFIIVHGSVLKMRKANLHNLLLYYLVFVPNRLALKLQRGNQALFLRYFSNSPIDRT